jgi:hypothetical protein
VSIYLCVRQFAGSVFCPNTLLVLSVCAVIKQVLDYCYVLVVVISGCHSAISLYKLSDLNGTDLSYVFGAASRSLPVIKP